MSVDTRVDALRHEADRFADREIPPVVDVHRRRRNRAMARTISAVAVFIALVVAVGALNAGPTKRRVDVAKDGKGKLADAIIATRNVGTAHFTLSHNTPTSGVGSSDGIVDLRSGNARYTTSWRPEKEEGATRLFVADEVRVVNGAEYARIGDDYRAEGDPEWVRLDEPNLKYADSVATSDTIAAGRIETLLDAIHEATNAAVADNGDVTFSIAPDVAKKFELLWGANDGSEGISVDVGAVNPFNGAMSLDSKGRIQRVHLEWPGPAGFEQYVHKYDITFDRFGSAVNVAAPDAATVGKREDLCASRDLKISDVIDQYRARFGANTRPTSAELQLAGMLQRPATWVIQWNKDSYSAMYVNEFGAC